MPGCPSACSAEALERLLSAPWPGNVREMRSVVERAMILARGAGEIGVEHLPSDVRRGAGGGGGGGGRGGSPRTPTQPPTRAARSHIAKTPRLHRRTPPPAGQGSASSTA